MKNLVILTLMFSLASCGLNARLEGIELSGISGVAKSDAVKGSEVGSATLSGAECTTTGYSLEDDKGGLFEINSEGKVLLAKDNPAAGTYNLAVIGTCDDQTAETSVIITINRLLGGSCDSPLNIKTTTTCTHCRIFEATDNTSPNGSIGGIMGADNICNTDSNKPSTGTYKAFLVDSCERKAFPVRRNWILAPNTMYYRAFDDQLIGSTDSNGLFVVPLNDFLASGPWYFVTGMEISMGSHLDNCNDWTSASASDSYRLGEYGTGTSAEDAWSKQSFTCDSIQSFLCVEQ